MTHGSYRLRCQTPKGDAGFKKERTPYCGGTLCPMLWGVRGHACRPCSDDRSKVSGRCEALGRYPYAMYGLREVRDMGFSCVLEQPLL